VRFSYHLQDGDRVAVYPYRKKINGRFPRAPRRSLAGRPKFVLDIHLGKLVRHLRLLGFDSIYETGLTDEEIVRIALAQKRVVLTRDIGLLKQKRVTYGYWVRSKDPLEQIEEVLKRFDLKKCLKPFTLCLECNGRIRNVPKQKILASLPPKVRKYYDEFYRCWDCGKVYWQGSHYERLSGFIKSLKPYK